MGWASFHLSLKEMSLISCCLIRECVVVFPCYIWTKGSVPHEFGMLWNVLWAALRSSIIQLFERSLIPFPAMNRDDCVILSSHRCDSRPRALLRHQPSSPPGFLPLAWPSGPCGGDGCVLSWCPLHPLRACSSLAHVRTHTLAVSLGPRTLGPLTARLSGSVHVPLVSPVKLLVLGDGL